MNWEDKGLGKVVLNSQEVYFRVIEWREANQFRESELKLPAKDFHITVGFSHSDLHDQTKDISTIIHPAHYETPFQE
jgi:hypothetical protein